MGTDTKIARGAYEAYTQALVPGQEGVPSCFTPMTWEELQPEVRGAYEAAVKLVRSAEHEDRTVAQLVPLLYQEWCSKLPGSHRPWKRVVVSIVSAWLNFTHVAVRELRKARGSVYVN